MLTSVSPPFLDFSLIRALTQALANLLTGNTNAVAETLPGLVQTSFDANLIS